jgi:hypothetical protein
MAPLSSITASECPSLLWAGVGAEHTRESSRCPRR